MDFGTRRVQRLATVDLPKILIGRWRSNQWQKKWFLLRFLLVYLCFDFQCQIICRNTSISFINVSFPPCPVNDFDWSRFDFILDLLDLLSFFLMCRWSIRIQMFNFSFIFNRLQWVKRKHNEFIEIIRSILQRISTNWWPNEKIQC